MNQQLPLLILPDLPNADVDGEGEDDLASLDTASFSQAVVFATDWTAETILRQLEKGNISLDPGYQRRDAWRPDRKSRFIESILLGLPIPQLVLAEEKGRKGSYIVIDGKQRLLSLRQFAAGPGGSGGVLKLTGLSVRKDLEGKALSELEADPMLQSDVSAFQNQPIRTVVLRNWPNEDFLYLVFLRLNTGSVQLSPQELRQALHPGKFVDFTVKRSAESKGLQKFLQIRSPDFRMRDVELLVRYYAFRNFIESYTGNLKAFMDQTCLRLNEQWDGEEEALKSQADDMDSAIEATFDIFGDSDAFRKWDGDKFQARRNRAVFDIMIFYFSHEAVRVASVASKAEVKEAFKVLCQNKEFVRTLETTTKSLTATQYRLSEWGRTLSAVLKLLIKIPQIAGAH